MTMDLVLTYWEYDNFRAQRNSKEVEEEMVVGSLELSLY